MRRAATAPRPPQKWRKYQLLELFGLADTQYLSKTIRRYPWAERFRALNAVRREFLERERDCEPGSHLFVVKFVPPALAMLLPNVRVQNREDFVELEKALTAGGTRQFQEIWFCRTDVAVGTFSVAGRIRVDGSASTIGQFIEQVWRCSPRLIESLDDDFPYPFVRAYRPSWGWAPRIEKLYRPNDAPETEKIIEEQFRTGLRRLETIRERLESFVESIFAAGADVCVLEYKIEGSRLQIIDWDTVNEAEIINRLLPYDSP